MVDHWSLLNPFCYQYTTCFGLYIIFHCSFIYKLSSGLHRALCNCNGNTPFTYHITHLGPMAVMSLPATVVHALLCRSFQPHNKHPVVVFSSFVSIRHWLKRVFQGIVLKINTSAERIPIIVVIQEAWWNGIQAYKKHVIKRITTRILNMVQESICFQQMIHVGVYSWSCRHHHIIQ